MACVSLNSSAASPLFLLSARAPPLFRSVLPRTRLRGHWLPITEDRGTCPAVGSSLPSEQEVAADARRREGRRRVEAAREGEKEEHARSNEASRKESLSFSAYEGDKAWQTVKKKQLHPAATNRSRSRVASASVGEKQFPQSSKQKDQQRSASCDNTCSTE